eukprot:14217382-Alexandrium_andersonii.AAC.1
MPATKYFPAEANCVKPPTPGVQQPQFAPRGCDVFAGPTPPASEMKTVNALNFEPPIPPSAPGKLRGGKPNVDRQQRGLASFKGSGTNKQSDANEKFPHYYFD